MRRPIVPLMLAVAAAQLVACGSAGHRTLNGGGGTATHPAPTTTGAAPTKPSAIAFAQAVNLTAADVPGFTASSRDQHESAGEKDLERKLLRCAGPTELGKGLTETGSKNYELKRNVLNLSVSSQVSVARTAAKAAEELSAMRSARLRGCFTHYLDLLFKGHRYSGATVGSVSIASGIPPAPGTAGGFGWRVTVPLTAGRIRVAFFMDILGFVKGPARVTLTSSGLIRPFPAAVQQRLFSLLLARAKAHAL
jgi:hypothetical protein